MTPPVRRRLLLIGWDAADWQILQPMLDEGLMPALAGLMQRGVHGNLASLEPMLSPMLWTTVATGRTADRHGVIGFVEADPVHGGARPWSSLTRQGKAIWNILHQHGWTCQVGGWWASHPAEPLRGTVVSNAFTPGPGPAVPVPAGCIHPPEAADTLAACRFRPDEVTAEHILTFVPRAAEVCQDTDRSLHSLANVLSSTVTWQAVTTEFLTAPGWDFTAVYFDGIDHFCHAFMPYHPPRRPHIPEHLAGLYGGVVRAACRFHDMMLARQLELAGPDTTVILCSDHGFRSGADRPLSDPTDPAGPTLWHRDMGVLVMAGPGIRQDTGRIFGASLLDITPTLLALAGLPAGEDMPGRALTEALDFPAPGPRIPSWDDVPGDDGRHSPGTSHPAPPAAPSILTTQLIALGYLEDHAGNPAAAAAAATSEAQYNLAQVFLSTGRPQEAVPILTGLLAARPWETRILQQLGNALARAGSWQQCRTLLTNAWPDTDPETPPPVVLLILARACQGLGDTTAAAFYTDRAASAIPALPGPLTELGSLFLTLGETTRARTAAARALALDPAFAPAWELQAAVQLRLRQDTEALASAVEATRHIHQMAGAHLYAGIALTRLGHYPEARAAFSRVAAMRPRDAQAWRWLAALPDTPSENAEAAPFLREACRETARRLSRERAASREARLARARSASLPFPDLPPPAERRAAVARHRPSLTPRPTPSMNTLTLVSGLPRSGTSLLMQMLEAGGLPPRTDGLRTADDDNPWGYYEWEAVKRLAREPSLLDDPALSGCAVKIISALLPSLPRHHRYRVLFLTRPLPDVLRSQAAMIARRGTTGPAVSPDFLARSLEQHRDQTLAWLRSQSGHIELLTVSYPDLLADPAAGSARIAAFLGPDLLPTPERMADAVRKRPDVA